MKLRGLRYAGHIAGMADGEMPKIMLRTQSMDQEERSDGVGGDDPNILRVKNWMASDRTGQDREEANTCNRV